MVNDGILFILFKYSAVLYCTIVGGVDSGICRGPGGQGDVLVSEFRGMALNGLFYADVLWPLNLIPLTDFTSNTTLEGRPKLTF